MTERLEAPVWLWVDNGRVKHIAAGPLKPAALGGSYGPILCHPRLKAYDWAHTEQWARKWRTDPEATLTRLSGLLPCRRCLARTGRHADPS